MKQKILIEITNFCKTCCSSSCCPEEDCVLFRIEKIILQQKNKNRKGEQKNEKSL